MLRLLMTALFIVSIGHRAIGHEIVVAEAKTARVQRRSLFRALLPDVRCKINKGSRERHAE